MTVLHRVGAPAGKYVFLHGTPGDSSVWSAVVARLPAGAGAVLVDLADHGAAADEPSGDPGAVEDSLLRALDAVGGKLVLVGHSYGAYQAARLASRLGERIERLLLISGLARIPDDMALAFRDLAAGLQSGDVSLDALTEVALTRWYGAGFSPADRAVVSGIVATTGLARSVRMVERLARLAEPRFHVAPYAQPAALLHGRDDGGVPLVLGEELAQRGESASLELLDTHLHMLPLSHAELVAARAFG